MLLSKRYAQLKFYSWAAQTAFLDKDGVFVVSYPRSGSSWLSRMIETSIKHHSKIVYNSDRRSANVVHTHRFFLSSIVENRNIYIVRDFRDIVISSASSMRKAIAQGKMSHSDLQDIYSVQPEWLDPSSPDFSQYLGALVNTRVASISWNEHVARAMKLGMKIVRYEDLRADTVTSMSDILGYLLPDHQININEVVSAHSISAESQRSRLKLNVREGSIAGWQKYHGTDWVCSATEYACENLNRLNYPNVL